MNALFPQSAGDDGQERLRRAWAPPRGFAFFKEINNTRIGILYVATGFIFFLAAGVLALLMRIQLAVPGNNFLDAATYNQFFTMHGTVMMFLFAVPIVEAVAVLLLPAMLGTRDLPFPRLSAFGYWCYAIGGVLVFSSLFFGAAPDGGWFMYPPLTGSKFSPGINTDIWILGLGFVEISAVSAAIELIVGILRTRAPGMSLSEMPIFAWYMLVTAAMILVGMPPVIVADLLLELERGFGMPFFDPTRGGDPLLWQHLFWLFGHPEVYIIFLPAAGMVSMMLPTFARTPLVGYTWIVMAALAIGFLSFGLWVHHMYTTGLPRLSLAFFSAASSAIAIPMGIQVFAWIATLWAGRPVLRVPMLFVLGFLAIFTLGGLTGVMVASVPYDWQVHDTYFVVAHLHYVLIGGMVFPLIAAVYYWLPAVTGRHPSERLGRVVFWLMFIGFNGAFLPMHLTGLRGMPRRVYTYADYLGWNTLNLVSTVFAFVFALGVVMMIIDVVRHVRRDPPTDVNPWGAPSLEWAVSNEPEGIRSLPHVTSRYPLWDAPDLPRDLREGRGYLPDAPTLERQALLTAPMTGRPEQILTLPGPTWLPLVAAASLATVFAALTLKLMLTAVIAGALTLALIGSWLWALDAAQPRLPADAGRGLALPLYQGGNQSLGSWAIILLIAADASTTASIAFAYLFLWTSKPHVAAAAGAVPIDMATLLLALALAVAGASACWLAWRRLAGPRAGIAPWCLLLSTLAGAASAWLLWRVYAATGLDPRANAFAATTWILIAWGALHVVLAAVASLWAAARHGLGMIDAWRDQTLIVVLRWWQFSAVVVLVVSGLVMGAPHAR